LSAVHIIDKDLGKYKICAGSCLGIKDIYIGGEVKKVGYVFDLRVHEGISFFIFYYI
jgi:hypothetical protein